jgi:maleate isomerase
VTPRFRQNSGTEFLNNYSLFIRFLEDRLIKNKISCSFFKACAHALHIAHIPDWAKEKAIMELLATANNNLDAIVQCGTNMSLINVCEKLEPIIDIPILGVNAVIFWYALRENGFTGTLVGGGKLLRDF